MIERHEVREGRIYFITDGEAIKIGFATNVRERMIALQTSHHFPLFLIGSIPGTDAEERALHRRFDHLRLMGEWFRITPELFDLLDELDGQMSEGDNLERWSRKFFPPEKSSSHQ